MSKGRVLLAMSGGIDSSMAALLLREEGYEIIGITMKTWDYSYAGSNNKETGCCNLDTINDARSVAVKLGFPHYIIDLKKEFNELIVSDFINSYMSGYTPNPCVLCNALIKWGALLKKADTLNCNFLATGHYVKLYFENNRYVLSMGKDITKDQSYVLWQLTQINLKRTIFPLGNYTKDEIRILAKKNGFNKIARKKESYEICFIPNDDYRSFLRCRIPDIDLKIGHGNFVDTQGNIIGRHKGYPFYTIGQRKGLEVALGYPLYVKKIDAVSNTIVLGKKEDLNENTMLVSDVNLIKYHKIAEGFHALVKIRYKDKGCIARLYPEPDNTIRVIFNENVTGITPGQSAVFYEGNDVVGGGIIKKVL